MTMDTTVAMVTSQLSLHTIRTRTDPSLRRELCFGIVAVIVVVFSMSSASALRADAARTDSDSAD